MKMGFWCMQEDYSEPQGRLRYYCGKAEVQLRDWQENILGYSTASGIITLAGRNSLHLDVFFPDMTHMQSLTCPLTLVNNCH